MDRSASSNSATRSPPKTSHPSCCICLAPTRCLATPEPSPEEIGQDGAQPAALLPQRATRPEHLEPRGRECVGETTGNHESMDIVTVLADDQCRYAHRRQHLQVGQRCTVPDAAHHP